MLIISKTDFVNKRKNKKSPDKIGKIRILLYEQLLNFHGANS